MMRGAIQKGPSVGAGRALMVVLCAGVGLAACATAGPKPHYVVSGPPSSSSEPPTGRSGLHGTMAPYQVNGRWYTPHAQPDYDEVGVASWYGAQFHYHRTANGEVFDQNAVSAAHTTLPIPSIIEVTNLANNKSIRVRLNDRGPFVDGRILDLSREAAAELGYERQGVARVRVRYIGPAPALPVTRLASAAGATTPAFAHEGRSPHHAGDIEDQDFPVHDGVAARYAPRRTAAVEAADIEDAGGEPPARFQPASQTVAVRGGGYSVQVGAYSSRETADRIAARLADTGSTSIQSVQRNGATIYKVRLGDFPDARSAASARARVAAAGMPDARVIGPQ